MGNTVSAVSGLLHFYPFKTHRTKWINLEFFHIWCGHYGDHRMRHGGPRQFLFEDLLRFHVALNTLVVIGNLTGFGHQLIEVFVTPLCVVVTAYGFTA